MDTKDMITQPMTFTALGSIGVTYLDQAMDSGNVAAASKVDDVLVRGVDCQLGAVVSNTSKVGAEEGQHDGHGSLGEDLVVSLSDKVGAKDDENGGEIHDLTAPTFPELLERY